MNALSTLILASLLTACGMPQAISKASDSANNTDTSTNTSTNTSKDKTFETTGEAGSNTEVTAETKVTVKTGTDVAKKLTWHYIGALKPWFDAKQAAPKGYRLATRAEILGALAKGALADMGNVTVWTGDQSDDREDYIWTIRLKDSYPIVQYQESSYASLYVKE